MTGVSCDILQLAGHFVSSLPRNDQQRSNQGMQGVDHFSIEHATNSKDDEVMGADKRQTLPYTLPYFAMS